MISLDDLQEKIHMALRPFLFGPNTKKNRAEMVEILEETLRGAIAEDMTTDSMAEHGAVRFFMSDGSKKYKVEYGPGYPHVIMEER